MNALPSAVETATAAAAKVSASSAAVLDLGRQLAVILAACGAHDEGLVCRDIPKADHDRRMTVEQHCRQAQSLLLSRADGLTTIIATTPAQTLADAAVQVGVAASLALRLAANENTEQEVEDKAEKIERMMLSALPIIAAAAGLDMAAMGWDELDQLRIARFAGAGLSS